LQRIDEAHAAYEQAARIHPADARTCLNLAYTHLARGQIEAALVAIARGLAADQGGAFTERLLAKQREALGAVATQSRERQARAALWNQRFA
jgi:Flp pilus assembly protein TadD